MIGAHGERETIQYFHAGPHGKRMNLTTAKPGRGAIERFAPRIIAVMSDVDPNQEDADDNRLRALAGEAEKILRACRESRSCRTTGFRKVSMRK